MSQWNKNRRTSKFQLVLQSFYLDKIHHAVVHQADAKRTEIQLTSDMQGSEPWCQPENGGYGCPKSSARRPVVTMRLAFDHDDFLNTKLGLVIDNFPYKYSNSTLALQAKLYSDTLVTAISDADKNLRTQSSSVDCSVGPG